MPNAQGMCYGTKQTRTHTHACHVNKTKQNENYNSKNDKVVLYVRYKVKQQYILSSVTRVTYEINTIYWSSTVLCRHDGGGEGKEAEEEEEQEVRSISQSVKFNAWFSR